MTAKGSSWARAAAQPRLGPPGTPPVPLARRHSIPTQRTLAAQPAGGDHRAHAAHISAVPSGYLILRVWAEMYEDAQKARIACANRIGRGGVDPLPYMAQLKALEAAEHGVALAMRRCYRASIDPEVVTWQKATRGIGEHLLARLLGIIGHPVHTTAHHWEDKGAERKLIDDGPMERSVSQLWSYCGHGDATRKRRAGMTAEEAAATGNPRAKMVVHLIAESVVKARGPHRVFYDERRMDTVDRGWTPMHSHNDALRILGKAILKDLWLASRDVHGPKTTQEGAP